MILVVEGRQFSAIRRSGFYNGPGHVWSPSSHNSLEGTIYVLLRSASRDQLKREYTRRARARSRGSSRARGGAHSSELNQ